MGISQSLSRATEHPKFPKVQYGVEKDLTVIHYELQEKEIKQWRRKLNQQFPSIQTIQQKQQQQQHTNVNQQSTTPTPNNPNTPPLPPSLLVISPSQYRTINNGFCSTQQKISIKINHKILQTTLKQQIQQRSRISRFYQQQEIWFMMFKVVESVALIHQSGSGVEQCYGEDRILGNLHPGNVLLTKDGELVLVGEISLPKEKNHFLEFKEKGIQYAFIAPQLVCFLTNKTYKQYPNYPSCINKQKVQSYGMGLTLLCLCCLQSSLPPNFFLILQPRHNPNYSTPHVSRQSSSRHNFTNLINQQYLQQKLHFIQSRYSRLLYTVIKGLLQDVPENRLSLVELWNVLLKQKKYYILSMDQNWYFQSLDPIAEYNQNCEEGQVDQDDYNDEDQNQVYYNQNQYPQNQTQQKLKYKNLHIQTFLQLQQSKQVNNNDSKFQIWQRSLQKQRDDYNNKKVGNIELNRKDNQYQQKDVLNRFNNNNNFSNNNNFKYNNQFNTNTNSNNYNYKDYTNNISYNNDQSNTYTFNNNNNNNSNTTYYYNNNNNNNNSNKYLIQDYNNYPIINNNPSSTRTKISFTYQ